MRGNNKKDLLYTRTYSNRTRELTFIAIITANYFSTSNPTLSLPQSSSIFANLSNRSDMQRKEDPET
jgi:hypothetical protein